MAVENLNRAETVDGRFRYMQALAVEGICLNCHGENIGTDVLQAIHRQYPDDKVTGCAPGQIRGAFSLSRRRPDDEAGTR